MILPALAEASSHDHTLPPNPVTLAMFCVFRARVHLFPKLYLPGSLCISERQAWVSVSISLVFYTGTLDCNTLPPTCGYRICFLRTMNKRSSISHEINPTFVFPHTLPFIVLQGQRQYDSCGIHFVGQIMVHVPQELMS